MWALDGLVETGIDVLQALQFSADGMDPEAMKRGWGDRLCFEGGVSVQTTLPFGTVEEVRAEVRERIDVLGRGGGYILGPSHSDPGRHPSREHRGNVRHGAGSPPRTGDLSRRPRQRFRAFSISLRLKPRITFPCTSMTGTPICPDLRTISSALRWSAETSYSVNGTWLERK